MFALFSISVYIYIYIYKKRGRCACHVTDDVMVADGAEFYAGYPAYADYFASHHHHHHHHPHHAGPDPASAMTYLPPTSGQQPGTLLDQVSGMHCTVALSVNKTVTV